MSKEDAEMFVIMALRNIHSIPIIFIGSSSGKIFCYRYKDKALTLLFRLHGHTDAVTELDILRVDDNSVFLSSSSKDECIRIWRFSILDKYLDDKIIQDSVYQTSLDENSPQCAFCVLDSVILGHDKWVNGCSFHHRDSSHSKLIWPIHLVSGSNDCNIILWRQESESQPWTVVERFGSTGQHSIQWLSARINQSFNRILALGIRGNISIWRRDGEKWTSSAPILGHNEAITSVKWSKDPYNFYLLSSSLDKTVRLHSQIAEGTNLVWFETGRPQVHGYEINSICFIDEKNYASGGNEKILRLLHARSDGESVIQQELALSNLPNKTENPSEFVLSKTPLDEDNLYRETLWPEKKKLYGHALEVFTLDVSPNGQLICSASKSTKKEHAFIIIWKREDEENWIEFQRIFHHNLTIVSLHFSQHDNGAMLLSGSRDRTWTVFKSSVGAEYSLYASSTQQKSSHARIIWSARWLPNSHDFLTASRDKKIILWSHREQSPEKFVKLSEITYPQPISSMEITQIRDLSYFMSVGFEDGSLKFIHCNKAEASCLEAWKEVEAKDSDRLSTCPIKCIDMKLIEGNVLFVAVGDENGILQVFITHFK